MNELIRFADLSIPFFSIWIIGLIVSLLFEFRRNNKAFRMLRLMAVLILFFAVAMLWWKPQIKKDVQADMIILQGLKTSPITVDSLQKIYRGAIIQNPDSLGGSLPASTQVILTGYGLPDNDFWKLKEAEVLYVPAKIPNGIIDLSFSKDVVHTDSMHIVGSFSGRDETLYLTLGTTLLDSSTVDQYGGFQFSFVLNTSGALQLTIASGEISNILESLNIHVKNIRPLKVAMISATPSFEMRELKEFLLNSGNSLFIQSTISRDRFITEKVHWENLPGKAGPDMWKEIDLLITDQGYLKSLSRSRYNDIDKEIGNGLGMYVANPGVTVGREKSQFSLATGSPDETSVPKTLGLNFKKSIGFEAISMVGERILSGFWRFGNGKIGTAIWQDTYSLKLAGNEELYNRYWAELLTNLARSEEKIFNEKEWPAVVDRPVGIGISSEQMPEIIYDNAPLPPIQDIYNSENWEVKVWPDRTGWTNIHNTTDTLNFYVYDAMNWQPYRLANQRIKNLNRFNSGNLSEPGMTSMWVPAGKIIPLFCFFLCLIFLWVEPRLDTKN